MINYFSTNIVRGDTRTIPFELRNPEDGSAIDLTNVTAITFTMAKSLTATVAVTLSLGAGITITGDPTAGLIAVALSGTNTDIDPHLYLAEVELTDATGKDYTVRTADDKPFEITILDNLD